MAIHFRKTNERIIIFGQTFAYKEEIKRLGGRFNGADKTWFVSNTPAALAGIRLLCENAGGGELAATPAIAPPNPGPIQERNSTNADDLPPWDTVATVETADALTVSQLMLQAQQVVARGFPNPLWVCGEIQSFANRSGAFHFNLSEIKDGATDVATIAVKAVAWQNSITYMRDRHSEDKIKELFADGMKIRCLVRVTFYKDRGQLSLIVEDVDPAFTKGAQALAREKLLKELRAKGLDRTNKMLQLPAFVLRVGLISAEGSRALSDFTHQLEAGRFAGSVLLCPAAMQGDRVIPEVTSAIENLAAQEVDVIVMTRGGGSAADLRWFDAAEIAYAVAQCPVPVVAAIGHHDDVCVTEEICHTRQKTPTAAAQFLVDWQQGTRERLTALTDQIYETVVRAFERHNLKLEFLRMAMIEKSISVLNRTATHLTNLQHNIIRSADQYFATCSAKILMLEKSLAAADPRPWLKKGWTQLRFTKQVKTKTTINSVKSLDVGDQLDAVLADGIVRLKIESIETR